MSAKPCFAARAGFGDCEHSLFCLIEQVFGLAPQRAVNRFGDAGADLSELAHDGPLAHDFRIATDVGGARGVHGERSEVRLPAHLFELRVRSRPPPRSTRRPACLPRSAAECGEDRRDGRRDRNPRLVEQIEDFFPRAVVEQQPAQHGLLGLDRIRRQLRAPSCGSRLIGVTAWAMATFGGTRGFFQLGNRGGNERKSQRNLLKKRAVASPFFIAKNSFRLSR